METLATVIATLRALIDAAFRTGGVAEAHRSSLHQKLNEIDPAVQEAEAQAAAGLTEEEKAELARLESKQAAAAQPAERPVSTVTSPVFSTPQPGSEETGFRG